MTSTTMAIPTMTSTTMTSEDRRSIQLTQPHFNMVDALSHTSETPMPPPTPPPSPTPTPIDDAGAVVVPVQNQIRTMFGLHVHDNRLALVDVIAVLGYLDGHFTQLQGDYDSLGAVIYTTLTLCLVFQVALVGAISYLKGFIGCDGWWNQLILLALALSALASTATIIVVFHKFHDQFDLCKLGRRLREQRNFILEGCIENGELTIYRGVSLFRAADHTEFSWCSQRAVFLVILIAFAACLLFACACFGKC